MFTRGDRPAVSVSGMDALALLRLRRSPPPTCLVCGKPVRANDPQMRFHQDTRVHRGCATYRMRAVRDGRARLGNPPR